LTTYNFGLIYIFFVAIGSSNKSNSILISKKNSFLLVIHTILSIGHWYNFLSLHITHLKFLATNINWIPFSFNCLQKHFSLHFKIYFILIGHFILVKIWNIEIEILHHFKNIYTSHNLNKNISMLQKYNKIL
jgi:hypothetical protein